MGLVLLGMVDCLGQHIMPGKAGDVQSRPGAIMAGCDSLRIRVFGRFTRPDVLAQADVGLRYTGGQ